MKFQIKTLTTAMYLYSIVSIYHSTHSLTTTTENCV